MAGHLQPGGVIIDGGNTYYRDDSARAMGCEPFIGFILSRPG